MRTEFNAKIPQTPAAEHHHRSLDPQGHPVQRNPVRTADNQVSADSVPIPQSTRKRSCSADVLDNHALKNWIILQIHSRNACSLHPPPVIITGTGRLYPAFYYRLRIL
jgi:hypothetical protein